MLKQVVLSADLCRYVIEVGTRETAVQRRLREDMQSCRSLTGRSEPTRRNSSPSSTRRSARARLSKSAPSVAIARWRSRRACPKTASSSPVTRASNGPLRRAPIGARRGLPHASTCGSGLRSRRSINCLPRARRTNSISPSSMPTRRITMPITSAASSSCGAAE